MDMILKTLIFMISIPVVFVIALFFSTIPFHDIVHYSFANELFSIPTDEGALVVERERKIGILLGNGNHCDYYAGLILKTNKSKKSLYKYYTSKYEGNSEIKIARLDKYSHNTNSNTIYFTTNDGINHSFSKKKYLK